MAAPSRAALTRFHDLIKTPVQDQEVLTKPCHLPQGVTPAERATWFTGTSFEFPAPSRISIVGFLLSWVAIGLMIGGFLWLMAP